MREDYIAIFCILLHFFLIFDFARASAKWEAWNSKKGMEQGIARKEYIEMVEKMKDKHGLI